MFSGLARWLRIRRWVGLLLLAGACAGCGFHPLLGRSANPLVQDSLAQVKIDMIPDRSGQILRNYLLDGLSPKGLQGPTRYRLQIVLTEPRREVAIQRDNTASRVAYTASVSFRVFDEQRRLYVFQGSSLSETTYEVTTSEFATVSSLSGARDRVLQDVSSDIRLQLADFFAVSTSTPERP